MNNEQSSAAWMYFRIFIGGVLLVLFVYLVVTDSFDADLISRLLMLLIGILEAGSGVVQFRALRFAKKK